MTRRIALIAACLITGLVVGYNLNSPSSPEIRRAIPVNGKYAMKSSDGEDPFSKYAHPDKTEPEVRRAIPVQQPEVRKAIPVHKEQPAVVYVPITTVADADDDDDDDDDDDLPTTQLFETLRQNDESSVRYYHHSVTQLPLDSSPASGLPVLPIEPSGLGFRSWHNSGGSSGQYIPYPGGNSGGAIFNSDGSSEQYVPYPGGNGGTIFHSDGSTTTVDPEIGR